MRPVCKCLKKTVKQHNPINGCGSLEVGHRISLVYFLNTILHVQAVWLCACSMILKACCKPMVFLVITQYAKPTRLRASAAGTMHDVSLLKQIKALIPRLKPRKAP